ncbi:MAG: cbb3-type cytochrome c oxidase subunit I [Methyloligellaceae bacterium]
MTDTTERSGGLALAGDLGPRAVMFVAGLVFVLLMLFGLIMRANQAGLIEIDPSLFYQLMTAHGVGMVGTSGIAGAAIMWHFLRAYAPVSPTVFWLITAIFLVGVVLILAAIFLMDFAAAWTFLYPLPAKSAGVWGPGAAVVYLLGLLLVGVAFLVFNLDAGRAILASYGSLTKALGWPTLFGSSGDAPPPTVVVSTVVVIINTLALVVGAAIIVISLINVLVPTFAIDALLAKNLIFFFGHVFINATIYMAIIAVYEIVPRYTGRPWPASRIFLASWAVTFLIVLTVYPHHLFQDVAMPSGVLATAQILSYLSGIPVLAVTTLSLLGYLYGANVKWDLPLALLVLGVFGWAGGAVPAVIDGIVVVNKIMHNTMWVPGHFHFYLLLGVVAMAFGFMMWLARSTPNEGLQGAAGLLLWCYVLGGMGLVGTFLVAGSNSVPRRWAVHIPEWQAIDMVATAFAALSVLGAAYFLIRYLVGFNAQPPTTDAAE